jgi:hypothetical protein
MSSNPIASAIFIRQSPDYSGLCRFWGLVKPSAHTSALWQLGRRYLFFTGDASNADPVCSKNLPITA